MTTLSFESASGDDSGNGQLLRDIEEISKALCLPKASRRPLISFLNVGSESVQNTCLPYAKSKLDLGFNGGDEQKINRDKKYSVWPWKPLKALSHIWRRKFNCCFFCHVHHIENLPSTFDGLDMSVHWKRKDNLVRTLVSRVSNGFVEFEDTLMSRCSVYGARSGPENFVKYEPKHFLLYASVVGSEGLDIGKHWIDLTRLLPLVFEELEEDKSSGKWTTSFKLGGKAKGAALHVSFGFLVMSNSLLELGDSMRLPLVFNLRQNGLGSVDDVASCRSGNTSVMLRRVASVPSSLGHESSSSSQCSDVKELHQVWPNPRSEFLGSVDFLCSKLDEENMGASTKLDFSFDNSESVKLFSNSYCDAGKEVSGNEWCGDDDDGTDFTVAERGIELEWPMEEQVKLEESAAGKMDVSSFEVIDVAESLKDEVRISDKEINLDPIANGSGASFTNALLHNDSCACETEMNTEELDLEIQNLFISESLESESLVVCSEFLREEICESVGANPRASKMVDSLSLDAVMKAVADDFFNLLGEKNDPYNSSRSSDCESPRERLWREFENDVLASGSFLFDSDALGEEAEFSCSGPATSCSDSMNEDTFQLPAIHTATMDLTGNQSRSYKTKPQMLECLETQSLMQSWGFSEEAFQGSPDSCSGGFGSPIYLPPDEPDELPPLGEGLGPILQLNDGGFLMSMSPSLFKCSKNGGTLIIQVSRPAVLPADMGSEILEVLQCMASGGPEVLSKQAHELMPLTDLSGKIIQKLAFEESCSEETSERLESSQHELYVKLEAWGSLPTLTGCGFNLTSKADGSGCGYISVKNLVPLVMDGVGSLSVEGLRIQSGMSDMAAPASIKLKSEIDHSAFRKNGDCIKSSEEGGAGLQLPTVTRTGESIESLSSLSLSLDEWLKLDSGLFGDQDCMSETTSRLMAAHHAKSCYFSMGKLVQEDNREKASLKCGLLGDDLVIALRIQLRDPLRNFESVGTPMLALVQVKRVFENPGLSEQRAEGTYLEEEIDECFIDRNYGGESIARFLLQEVHVAGLVSEPGNEEIWASRMQQQSGYRWLLANDMINRQKTNKSQLSKSNAIARSSSVSKKQQFGNVLWSICHKSRGFGDHFNDPYLRNPDIIFS